MQGNDVIELVPLLFMAAALGMDAFSICLGIGMQRLRLKRIAVIGLVIGIFHIIMPLIGMFIGRVISAQMDGIAGLVAGIILFIIGAQMFFSAFRDEKHMLLRPAGIGLILLALSVSIDSLTVGLSLGITGVEVLLAVFLFGAMSIFMSWAGLLLARRAHNYLGAYSELLGGSILCGFGIYIIFI